MKIHLVAIAKSEEAYIEDWMLYYYNLGIDYICIYDNNDYSLSDYSSRFITLSTLKDKISSTNKEFYDYSLFKDCKDLKDFLTKSNRLKSYQDKYEVIKWNKNQAQAYKHYLNTHKDTFDWLLICDIDEFIDLNFYKDFKDLIHKNNNLKYISFKWINYDDNDLIERDMSKPML